MSSLPIVAIEDQFAPLRKAMEEMIGFVHDATRHGEAAHEVERGLWTRLLAMGHQLLGTYFTLSSPGDAGECLILDDGRELKRLAARARPYRSVFGDVQVERFVYAVREGQKIEAIPLDARLQLPCECTSYLLQEWTEQFMLDSPYGAALTLIERVLGFAAVDAHRGTSSSGDEHARRGVLGAGATTATRGTWDGDRQHRRWEGGVHADERNAGRARQEEDGDAGQRLHH